MLFGAKKNRGDSKEELARLYDAHAGGLYGYVLSIVANSHDAEEVMQEVFAKLFKKLSTWTGVRDPKAYLFRAAHNEAVSVLRRKRIRRLLLNDVRECGALLLPSAGSLPLELKEELQAALWKLPVKQREVVVLKQFEDMTFEEIGAALDISPNTAASRYRYALEKLKKMLSDKEVTDGQTEESTGF